MICRKIMLVQCIYIFYFSIYDCGGVAEWLTHQTSNLRMAGAVDLNSVRGKFLKILTLVQFY
jgi:hypothetical protein